MTMIEENQKIFWKNIKNTYLKDCKILIETNSLNSSMLLLCSLIDIVSSFYSGRNNERGVAESYRNFIIDFMPIFTRTKFGDLLFSDKNRKVNDIADIIYYCYRNGTTHEGILPDGIEIISDKNYNNVMGFGAVGWVKLNIYAMYNQTITGIAEYEKRLKVENELQNKFVERYNYLKRQRFKKEILPKHSKID